MLVSVYYKRSLFHAHVMILILHIFMNVNKPRLNQTRSVFGPGSWPLRCAPLSVSHTWCKLKKHVQIDGVPESIAVWRQTKSNSNNFFFLSWLLFAGMCSFLSGASCIAIHLFSPCLGEALYRHGGRNVGS